MTWFIPNTISAAKSETPQVLDLYDLTFRITYDEPVGRHCREGGRGAENHEHDG